MCKEKYAVALVVCILLTGCNDEPGLDAAIESEPEIKLISRNPKYNYQQLFRNIYSGMASLAEARQALTDDDPVYLSNTVHALYSLRFNRGIIYLLDGMWNLEKSKYPEINWELIAKPPVKIALASTLNRMENGTQSKYVDYIRNYKTDADIFTRAQVVIALGLNGDPVDVEFIKTNAGSDNSNLSQSSIVALSLMQNEASKNALDELAEIYKDEPRGEFIAKLIKREADSPGEELHN